MSEGSGLSTRDTVSGQYGTFQNAPTWGKGTYGNTVDFSAATNKAIDYSNINAAKGLTKFSIETYIFQTGSGGSGYGQIIGKTNGTTNRYFILDNDNFAGGWGMTLVISFTGQGTWSVPYPTYNIWTHYVWTMDASSVSNTPSCYKNGVPITVTVRQVPTGTLPADSNTITVGNLSSSERLYSFGGQILYVRLYNSVLGADQAKSLYQNPFQIYTQPSNNWLKISSMLKSVNGLSRGSVKTINGLGLGSMKGWNGLV